MCSSPSHSQEAPNPSQDQSLDQNPPPHHDSSPQDLAQPINPSVQSDPDQEKSSLDQPNDSIDDDPEEEVEEDQEEQGQENPGAVLSAFPPPPSAIDALVDPNVVRLMMSPSSKRPFGKRKKGKGNVKKQQAIEKKLQTLLENLNPIPFVPSKILDFSKHEKLLRRLGLWEFFHIGFDRSIRADLIAQLVATYDPKSRCSYVNTFRIAVNRADLARAFKLPVKKEKGGNFDGVDLDFEALTEESIGFIEGFVSNWVLLHEDTWMMPNEVLNWTKAIKDGHPEKVDWAGLFWFMVEKELLKGDQLVDCYYASHLQYLIKSQREEVMVRHPEEVVLDLDQDGGDMDADEVVLKEQERVDLDVEEEVMVRQPEELVLDLDQGRRDMDADEVVLKEQERVDLDVELEFSREEVMVRQPEEVVLDLDQGRRDMDADEVVLKEQERVDLDVEEEFSREEKGKVEFDTERVVLREEQDGVELEEEKGDGVLKEQERVDLDVEEEFSREEKGKVESDTERVVLREEQDGVELEEEKGDGVKGSDLSEVQGNDVLAGPNVELTLGQEVEEEEKKEVKGAEMMDVEEDEEDEEQEQEQQLDQRQWLLDGKNNLGGHFMQPCNAEGAEAFDSFVERKEEIDELEEDEEDEEEEPEDEFDIGPSDDTLAGDGLTGNFLQAMETNHITFGSQGHLHDDSSIDLVDNRNQLQHLAAGGLSFYNDNGKREIDHEHDISHRSLDGSNKRLRIDGPADLKSLDFGTCMGQMQQMMVRARMLYQEKEQDLEQSNLNQQVLLNELQKRESMIDHLHKTKCEEIEKRDAEMYHLQRELYLMGNLLDDYRKALKQTNKAFTEYRQKCQLPEEPIYRDAGPGGAMLSTSEMEKQRLKEEEEYKLACSILEQKAKEAEEGYALQFGDYLDKVLWLEKKLIDIDNTFKEIRELHSKPKVSETEQQVVETSECPPELHSKPKVSETEQQVVETSECPPELHSKPKVSETEQQVVETSECPPEMHSKPKVSETEQQVVETSECPPELHSKPKVSETEQQVVETSGCPPTE